MDFFTIWHCSPLRQLCGAVRLGILKSDLPSQYIPKEELFSRFCIYSRFSAFQRDSFSGACKSLQSKGASGNLGLV